jgi:UDP-glucose 4-epimerase
MYKKSLVIGGSGFLGSNMIDILIKNNHKVTNFDIKKNKFHQEKVKFIKGSILNEKLISQIIKNKDYVFLFAGLSDLDEALIKPIETIRLNILSTCLIAKYCIKHNVKRLIFASSIYAGSQEGGFYSCSKRAAEDFILEYSKKYNLKFTILRYGSLFGKRSDNKNGLYRIIINAIKKNKLEYYGFPNNTRRYIDVITASKLTFMSLQKKYENKFLNLVGKESIKISKLFKLIEISLNKKFKKKYHKKKIIGHYVKYPTKFKVKNGKNFFMKKNISFSIQLKNYLNYLQNEKVYKQNII